MRTLQGREVRRDKFISVVLSSVDHHDISLRQSLRRHSTTIIEIEQEFCLVASLPREKLVVEYHQRAEFHSSVECTRPTLRTSSNERWTLVFRSAFVETSRDHSWSSHHTFVGCGHCLFHCLLVAVLHLVHYSIYLSLFEFRCYWILRLVRLFQFGHQSASLRNFKPQLSNGFQESFSFDEENLFLTMMMKSVERNRERQLSLSTKKKASSSIISLQDIQMSTSSMHDNHVNTILFSFFLSSLLFSLTTGGYEINILINYENERLID